MCPCPRTLPVCADHPSAVDFSFLRRRNPAPTQPPTNPAIAPITYVAVVGSSIHPIELKMRCFARAIGRDRSPLPRSEQQTGRMITTQHFGTTVLPAPCAQAGHTLGPSFRSRLTRYDVEGHFEWTKRNSAQS